MKIHMLKPSCADYELMPRTVCVGEKTNFILRALGMEAAFLPGQTYILRIIPQEQIITRKTLRIGDDTGYDEIKVVPELDGTLRFSYTFLREQIYTIRLLPESGQREELLADLRVFAAEADLWQRIPMRGNTHCHVCTSVDGHEDPAVAAATYRKAGFDYLAITDHHKVDGSVLAVEALSKLPHGLALYYGEEVHVPNAYIHIINVGARIENVGIDAWYHMNEDAVNSEVDSIARDAVLPEGVEPYDWAWRKYVADKIHNNGGIAIIAHPFWEYDAHNTSNDMLEYLIATGTFDAMEVLGGQVPGSAEANMQVAFWNDMRAKGYFIPVVGADDAHRRNYDWDYESVFNQVFTIIFAKEPSFEGFAEAIKNGYCAAVETYDGAPYHVYGTYRFVKYCIFLLDQYFPIHDELCFEEGCRMKDAYLGDRESTELLGLISGRVDRYYRRFFGKTEGDSNAK